MKYLFLRIKVYYKIILAAIKLNLSIKELKGIWLALDVMIKKQTL